MFSLGGGRGTWCKKPRKGLKYRCACTKPTAKNAGGGRGTWCKKSRKGLKYRCACTKFTAKNAGGGPGTWCKKSRKGLKYRSACTKPTAKNAGGRGGAFAGPEREKKRTCCRIHHSAVSPSACFFHPYFLYFNYSRVRSSQSGAQELILGHPDMKLST